MSIANIVLVIVLALSVKVSQAGIGEYEGSSFNEVWSKVTSDPYKLPQYKVSFGSLYHFSVISLINLAANRTLNDKRDIVRRINGYRINVYPNKLAHPNGICLAGKWKINKNNPYSGYFKEGSEALIIVRSSTAMSATKVGEDRAFGFAGKLFPTLDKDQVTHTANFFTVDDLGGTDAEHFTDVELTNEPPISFPGFSFLRYALKLKSVFSGADENPAVRQMYQVSELKEKLIFQAITPKNFKVSARKGQTVNFKDFRDELQISNYNKNLIFDISVGERSSRKLKWIKIGTITLTESVVSASCDRNLHFHHPKWKSNLKN